MANTMNKVIITHYSTSSPIRDKEITSATMHAYRYTQTDLDDTLKTVIIIRRIATILFFIPRCFTYQVSYPLIFSVKSEWFGIVVAFRKAGFF